MAVQNGDFQEAGAGSWLAAGWHRRGRRTTSTVAAGFAEGETSPLQDGLDFSSAEWSREGVTVLPDAETGPDGSGDADALVEETGDVEHRLVLAEPRTFRPGYAYTFGLYVRERGRPYAAVGLSTSSGTALLVVELAAGAIYAAPAAFGDVAAAHGHAVVCPGGWVRVELTCSVSAILSATPWVAPSPDGAVAAYPGVSGDGLRVWGAYLHSGARRGAEDHGSGWTANELAAVTAVEGEAAPFETLVADPTTWPVEDHERGWGKLRLAPASRAQALFGVSTGANLHAEGHERDWPVGQAPYYTAGSTTPAMFSSGVYAREAHDFAWDNATHPFNVVSGVQAAFDEGAGAADGHESAFADFQYSFDGALEALLAPGHTLSDGDSLHLYAQYGGAVPKATGVTESVRLYVVEAAPGEFKVSLSPGGTPIAFADPGVGQQFARADPKRFWSGSDVAG
jgi:hypothetical protein